MSVHALHPAPAERWSWAPALSGPLWLAICLMASFFTMKYEFSAGRLGSRQAAWPAPLRDPASPDITRTPGHTAIVAFLHPRCPCSKATVTQLLATLHAHPGAELIVPVFTPPDSAQAAAWGDSAYAATIRTQFPDARIVPDVGGRQAQRFGAYTSGTVLIYDAPGRELFRGGITNRRGGEGDNLGLQRFGKILGGQRLAQAEPSPVFGCPLLKEAARP